MELKMTECNGSMLGQCLLTDMLYCTNAVDYIKVIIKYKNDGILESNDSARDCHIVMDFVGDKPLCSWILFIIYFNDEKYYIVIDNEISSEAEDALDAMLAYAGDSHMFDFVQDNIRINVDAFEKELVLEF